MREDANVKVDGNGNGRRRILFVDDDRETREMMSVLLGENGHQVVAVSRGEDGMMLARQGGFVAIVLDAWLPGLDGIELCKSIRTFDCRTPIVFLSGAAQGEDWENAISAGAQGYFVKPQGLSDLQSYLKRLTGLC